ncbi:MAG: hypothetical protein IJ641_09960, partial [Lachnospiraceae bacterium]|nr:hypothetical protein [Lachnospiraceae bacterium]
PAIYYICFFCYNSCVQTQNVLLRNCFIMEMGMTNEQYKGMLLDQLEVWQEVKQLAAKANDKAVEDKADQQIAKINEKMKF